MAGDYSRWLATETAAAARHDIPRPADPFACILDPSSEYTGTVLELRAPVTCYRCDTPITGIPVTDPGDPLDRTWCSEECADDDASASYSQRYGAGVAT